jgi:1-acyl-sn-glycerol-3-phosphate acyltransferase
MFKSPFRWWFQFSGWTVVNNIPPKSGPDSIDKYVIIGAPHTSNWDFVYGMGAIDIMKLKVRFTIKKEWMFFPVGGLLNRLGALAIDRSTRPGEKGKNMVSAMADLLTEAKEDLMIVVTPEATRSRRENWKGGFYHVAKQAGVPILLGFIDYEKKQCGVKEVCYPSDDMEADMRRIMAFYQTTTPKHAELFSVDTRYPE